MIRCHMYYLKPSKYVYAFTIDDEYAELFESQRDIRQFNKMTRKLDSLEWSVFSNNMRVHQLIKIPLFDGKHDFEIIGTYEEDSKLSLASDTLDDKFSYYKHTFPNKYLFNEKYLKLIDDVTSVIKVEIRDDKSKDFSLRVNTFALFYYLFNHTFNGDKENQLIRRIQL